MEVTKQELQSLVKSTIIYTDIMYKKGLTEEMINTMVNDLVDNFINVKEGYEWED